MGHAANPNLWTLIATRATPNDPYYEGSLSILWQPRKKKYKITYKERHTTIVEYETMSSRAAQAAVKNAQDNGYIDATMVDDSTKSSMLWGSPFDSTQAGEL